MMNDKTTLRTNSFVQDILLTSPGFIKVVTPLSDNCNEKTLNFAIREAQIYQLQQILGTKLYNKLKYLVQEDEIGNEENIYYKDLLDHCQYFIAYTVITEVIVPLTYKIDNFGTGTTTDEHVQSLGINDVFQLKDYYTKKVDFYREQLQHYLLNNYKKLPEIDRCQVNAISSHLNTSATTSIFLGGARAKNSICRHETSISLEPVEFIWAGAQANNQVVDVRTGAKTITLGGYLFVKLENGTYETVEWSQVNFTSDNEDVKINGRQITLPQTQSSVQVNIYAHLDNLDAEDYATISLNTTEKLVEFLFIGVNNYSLPYLDFNQNGLKVNGNIYATYDSGRYEKIEWRNVDINFTNPDIAYAAELKDDGFTVRLTEQYTEGNIEITFTTDEHPVNGQVNITVEPYIEKQIVGFEWIYAELNNDYTSYEQLINGVLIDKGVLVVEYDDDSTELIKFTDCQWSSDNDKIEVRIEDNKVMVYRTQEIEDGTEYNIYCSYKGHRADGNAHYTVGTKPQPVEKQLVSARWRFTGRNGIGEAHISQVRSGTYEVPGLLEGTYDDGSIGILNVNDAEWTNANKVDNRLYFYVPDAQANQEYSINGTIDGVMIDTITLTVTYNDHLNMGFQTKPTQEDEYNPAMTNIWENMPGKLYQRSECGHLGTNVTCYDEGSIVFSQANAGTIEYIFFDLSNLVGRKFNQIRFYATVLGQRGWEQHVYFDALYDFYLYDYNNKLIGSARSVNFNGVWNEVVIDLDPEEVPATWFAYKVLAKPANVEVMRTQGYPNLYLAINCPSPVYNPDAGTPILATNPNMEQFSKDALGNDWIIQNCDTRIIFENYLTKKDRYSNAKNNKVLAQTGRGYATLESGMDGNTCVYPSKLGHHTNWLIWGADDNRMITDSDDSVNIDWWSNEIETDYYGLAVVVYPFTEYGVPCNSNQVANFRLFVYGIDADVEEWDEVRDRGYGYEHNHGELKELVFKFKKEGGLHIEPQQHYNIILRTYGLTRCEETSDFGSTRIYCGLKEVAFLTKEQMIDRGYEFD